MMCAHALTTSENVTEFFRNDISFFCSTQNYLGSLLFKYKITMVKFQRAREYHKKLNFNPQNPNIYFFSRLHV